MYQYIKRRKRVKPKMCPCGKVPDALIVEAGSTAKDAVVSGNCCNEWLIEFSTNFHVFGSKKMHELALIAWNRAGRGSVV
jgi:hypothetical protein